jgi:hypothetical protein
VEVHNKISWKHLKHLRSGSLLGKRIKMCCLRIKISWWNLLEVLLWEGLVKRMLLINNKLGGFMIQKEEVSKYHLVNNIVRKILKELALLH